MLTPTTQSSTQRVLLGSLIVLALMFTIGCGSSHPHFAPTPTPAPVATTLTQIRVGDAPADQVLAFNITLVSPMTALMSNGTKFDVPLGSNRIELSHMAAKAEPMFTLNLPQGTYTGAQITIADPAVTYIYSGWMREIVAKDFPGTQTVALTFDPPLVLSATSGVLCLDMNLGKAMIFSEEDSHELIDVKFTPEVFSFTNHVIGASTAQQHEDGELEGVTGLVVAVNGSTFQIKPGQSGSDLTVNVTSTTVYDGSVTKLDDVKNRIVSVEGYTDTNNAFIATEVEGFESAAGAAVEGLIIDTGESRDNWFDMVPYGVHHITEMKLLGQDATGANAKVDDLGWTFTVHTNYLPDDRFVVELGKVDMAGLASTIPGPEFPFDSAHIFAGQRVEVETSSAAPGADFATFTATQVRLQQQPVTGEIVYYYEPNIETIIEPNDQGPWFILKLPSDSYLYLLTGQRYIKVYQRPGTDLELLPVDNSVSSTEGTPALHEGDTVLVRGLLFEGSSRRDLGATSTEVFWYKQYLSMIARRIVQQETASIPF
ncbi:MAG TPA: DUF5666 domain-containing protein [Candidatus Angelobacter sp.]|nr:DUF5666 domain-containing protein [Candidatus Angelobacter sp.]